MTERELNILKENYNELVQIGRRTLEGAQWIPTIRSVFKWLGLDFRTDANGLITYLGNGQKEPPNDKYTMMCEKLSIIEPLLHEAHGTSLEAYLAGYNQAIKDAGIPIKRIAYATYAIKKKEETKE